MKYLAITAILCLILAGASFAGNVTMTEVITGGNLTLTMPEAFSLSSVTIGGSSTQNATNTAIYTVEDSRGTGLGWNLGFGVSDFETGGTPNRIFDTSAVGCFKMNIATSNITAVYGQAKDGTNGPLSINSGIDVVVAGPYEFVHAAANYGMGKYTIQSNHKLIIPASTYAGTYTGTLTATLNGTP